MTEAEDRRVWRIRRNLEKEGRERGGILRTERKDDYEVLLGESNCK